MSNQPFVHDFEKRGLGVAPFTFVRVARHAKAEAQCKRCGKAIKLECVIRSGDGREFSVGRECVRKVNDYSMAQEINAEFRRLEDADREARLDRAMKLLANPSVRAALDAKPHCHPWRAKQGEKLLGWVEFTLQNGGPRKLVEVAKVIEETAREHGLSTH